MRSDLILQPSPFVKKKSTTIDKRALKDEAHGLMLRGRYRDAASVYETLTREDANDVAAWLSLADVYRRLKRWDRAVSSYRAGARLLTEAGHTAKARAALSAAMRLAPSEPALLREVRALTAKQDPPQRPPPLPTRVPEPEPLDESEAPTELYNPMLDWVRPSKPEPHPSV